VVYGKAITHGLFKIKLYGRETPMPARAMGLESHHPHQ